MKQYHASAVEINGRAVLILGASGTGKSTLSRELMVLGGNLIGDDQIFLNETGESVIVSAHPNANGRMEVRGVGLFKAQSSLQSKVELVVNLDNLPQGRLPEQKHFQFGKIKLVQYDIKGLSHMASFIYLLLKHKIEIEIS